MKKHFAAAALAATGALTTAGCVQEVRIPENAALEPRGEWVSFVSGDLVVKFPGKTQQEIFKAASLALEDYGAKRLSEDRPEDTPTLPPAYAIYARVIGDLKVTIRITTESDFILEDTPPNADGQPSGKKKREWVQASISYGAFGNLSESQKIAAAICKRL
ncbi:MAG: hypothetical protein LBG65_01285 [Puniceicoccales bacterium]|jgi:hypothetical protein|nr:hypothetical protein [Puniceicoccales bacterium]